MEELTLTEPVVEPEKIKNKLRVISLHMDHETPTLPPGAPGGVDKGLFAIVLRDNYDNSYSYQYTGKAATDYIKYINTANFTTNSLHKRILNKLAADGLIPGGGTVTGTPDPPVE
jgi:hypothetical protein